jgi:hypothetical protein
MVGEQLFSLGEEEVRGFAVVVADREQPAMP